MDARKDMYPPVPSGAKDSILARYGVQPDEFEAAMEHYSRRPEAFNSLYQSVIDTLRAIGPPSAGKQSPPPDSISHPYDQDLPQGQEP